MKRRKKSPNEEPTPRPTNPLTHPRAFDAEHGMVMDERLFSNLTPKLWRPAKPRTAKDGS